MNQITVTVDLTARNLEILKQLCEGAPVSLVVKAPTNAVSAKPVEPCENLSEPFEKPVEVPAASVPEESAPAKTYTKTDVKAVCLKYSKAGRQEELRAAFAKFGAKKLTEIREADYPALMEVLGDAE